MSDRVRNTLFFYSALYRESTYPDKPSAPVSFSLYPFLYLFDLLPHRLGILVIIYWLLILIKKVNIYYYIPTL
ncbi:hypothetical protein VCRA2113O213_80113 [Vibrio crassostreae]|nr:hypothetical protein VCRA2110O182_60080 [Vibrio crassostreae]CAK2256321.1 hypothetical protein VCRA2113O213_80113 [Vibrio crassostreae]CAK2357394.1 hypothetical protein VCRA2111O408_60117 [Vibrio crassostreae]CAK2372151.1 hypothetical protein VCRA211O406_60120 [Vibrio crassostreae]CAK3502044.1 hypothetical protein VCRA2123O443_80079 [Vibrio crassostreae]